MTLLIIIGVIALIIILMYNTLISKKNQVENIFAGIDTALKKRFDLIPNIVASAKEYMTYEKELLNEVTQLRSQGMKPNLSAEQTVALDAKLTSALGSIMVSVENYPELKANENMIHLQRTLNEVEAQIAAARRAYNQAVTDYHNAIEMFPTNYMASYMNLKHKELFKVENHERNNINVKELFNAS
jgi:LemA protein